MRQAWSGSGLGMVWEWSGSGLGCRLEMVWEWSENGLGVVWEWSETKKKLNKADATTFHSVCF